MKQIKGKPVSPGIMMGKALLFNSHQPQQIVFKEKIPHQAIEIEINRFNHAVKITKAQLKKIYKNLQKTMGKESALIIETQYLLVKEGNLINDIRKLITRESVRAEWAIKQIEKKYIDIFNKVSDISFQERINDISDVLYRLLNNLKSNTNNMDADIENVILVATDIPPSISASLMSKGKILGLVLDEGGETSHTVILARTLEIPTILSTKNATELIANDDFLIVDGLNGEVIINPIKSFIAKTLVKKEKYQVHKENLKKIVKLADVTRDNHQFTLLGNIEMPFESDLLVSYGAKGIGLFRTEFLFTDPVIAFSPDQQYMIYKNIAQKFYPNPVVIRTFDVGRDKSYSYFGREKEVNPALGTMAVRLFLEETELFKTQIKAILRANEAGNVKLLFPMVTELEEIHTIKKIINQCKVELLQEKKLPNKETQVGIMIEIPGTVKIIKHLKDEIDFFSIGTNDLMQYLLAVDRNNSAVSYLYSPFHPAVVDILYEIRDIITTIGKEVTVCGEMAGKTFTALMLLGIGYTNFSMTPLAIAEIKRIFTHIHYGYIKRTVKQMTKLGSKTEIEEFLVETLLKKYPDLFIKPPDF
ncbi:MAG: phosphoenolpyruvate--protein phosphotransferase [Candidatus Aminicenantes bacterium]|jgi:phosphotransferase system enzyme I (PtsI)